MARDNREGRKMERVHEKKVNDQHTKLEGEKSKDRKLGLRGGGIWSLNVGGRGGVFGKEKR